MNRQVLMDKIQTVEGLTTEERNHLMGLLKNTKTYGLIWEDKPEKVETQLRNELPVLKEIADRYIPACPANNTTPEIDFVDGTKAKPAPHHVLIEGDNLHALTSLLFTHEGQIDVIYIDPPYNTGNKDFIYDDARVDKEDTFRHSKWLSFMAKRLNLAKKLLADTGLIFISIDDVEQAQLRSLCDEIYGTSNLVSTFIWRTDGNFDNNDVVKNCHEYIHVYAKNKTKVKIQTFKDINIDPKSKLNNTEIRNTIVKNGPKNPISSILLPAGFPVSKDFNLDYFNKKQGEWPELSGTVAIKNNKLIQPITATSGWSSAELLREFIDGKFKPMVDGKGQKTTFELSKTGAIEIIKERSDDGFIVSVLLNYGNTQNASSQLSDMGIRFPFPKPLRLIKSLLSFFSSNSSNILDFFAGSGTTLHATMELNAADGGTRQCILVTNNENKIAEEVCYERNKRVIQGYTTPKDVAVPGLGNNHLHYYQTAFVPAARNEDAMKQLTALSTELIQLKENCFDTYHDDELGQQNDKAFRVFRNDHGQYLVVLYYSQEQVEYTDQIIAWIQKLPLNIPKINIYAFSYEPDELIDLYYDVQDRIKVSPLPEAIYNAYRSAMRALVQGRAMSAQTNVTDEDDDLPKDADSASPSLPGL